MDNLYLSANFFKDAYEHSECVLINSVTKTNAMGLPISITQEDKKNKFEELKIKGTGKYTKLVGNSGCPDLIAASVYGTNLVYFLSLAAKNIKWKENKRQIFN